MGETDMTQQYDVDWANIYQNVNTYNCSGKDNIYIRIIDETDIYDVQQVKASMLGSTLTLKYIGTYIYKFTNISDIDNVFFNFYSYSGEHRYSGHVRDLLKDFPDPDATVPKSFKGTKGSDVADAVQRCNDSTKLNQLLNCYSSVKYSDAIS